MLTLYHVPFSRSFRTLWLLQEMGIETQIVLHDIRSGSMRDPEFLAKSPVGRVPALEIDGRVLFESGAITEYLTETRPDAGMGRAVGHPERADFLQWLHFAETMATQIEQLNLSHIFLRDPSQASPIVLKIVTARLKGTLAAMSSMLGEQEYLLPSGFSAADTMMGFNLFAAPYYVKLDPFPNLQRYKERLEAREGYQLARMKDGAQDFYTKDFYPIPGTEG